MAERTFLCSSMSRASINNSTKYGFEDHEPGRRDILTRTSRLVPMSQLELRSLRNILFSFFAATSAIATCLVSIPMGLCSRISYILCLMFFYHRHLYTRYFSPGFYVLIRSQYQSSEFRTAPVYLWRRRLTRIVFPLNLAIIKSHTILWYLFRIWS